jgi:hypothetical protein
LLHEWQDFASRLHDADHLPDVALNCGFTASSE